MISIIILMVALVIIFAALVTVLVTAARRKENGIYTKGIETDAVVSSVERKSKSYNCYVTYNDENGVYREGLLNVSSNLPVGRKLKIKYIPEEYDRVVFVSQDLEN